MKILARHLTIDMYKCNESCFNNMEQLLEQMKVLLNESRLEVISADHQVLPDGHAVSMIIFNDGHMTIHAFPALRYISADTFLCQQNAAPELLFNTFRKLFKPENTKTTLLKRGDFGSVTDMKPKYKTNTAPMRKIRNTGNKVIRILTRKNS